MPTSFAERILFLDGLPNFQTLGRAAHRRECRGNPAAPTSSSSCEAVEQLKGAIAHCETRRATMSAATCSPKSSRNEEEHVDILEKQFDMIAANGPPELHPAAVSEAAEA